MKIEDGPDSISFFRYVSGDGRVKRVVALDVGLSKLMCAKYSRLMAERVFGIKYTSANAWDLKYVNNIVVPENNFNNIRRGDIITFFSVESVYNTRGNENLDSKGNARNCTHAGMVYDIDIEGRPVVVHQYVSDLEVGFLQDIEKDKRIQAVEIIRASSEI